ncbi:MAG: VOC family protein [Caulobacteraceae bacterium]
MKPCIDHLNRYVSDVDKFIGFYRDVLGYELIDRGKKESGMNYAILKGFGHELFISEKESFTGKDENFRHIGYSVEKVDETLEELKLKGYVEPGVQVIVKQFSRQFYIKDPDGFEIDLIEWTDKEGFYDNLIQGMSK